MHIKQLLALLAGLLLWGNAWSQSAPKVYQAEQILTGYATFIGTNWFYYVSGKNSRWQDGPPGKANLIRIANAALNVTYEINVVTQSYEVKPYDPQIPKLGSTFLKNVPFDLDKEADTNVKAIRTESVDGDLCDVYQIKEAYESGTFWKSEKYGMTVMNRSGKFSNRLKITLGQQSPALFIFPSEYQQFKRKQFFAVVKPDLTTTELFGIPGKLTQALCGDQQMHKIRFDKRNYIRENCLKHKGNTDQFCGPDPTDYDAYEFVDSAANDSKACLIGEDEFFRDVKVFPIHDNNFSHEDKRPACSAATRKQLETSMSAKIKNCWTLARFGTAGTMDLADYAEEPERSPFSFSVFDGKSMILADWSYHHPAGQSDSQSDSQSGTEKYDASVYYHVVAAMSQGDQLNIIMVVDGNEGVNYWLLRGNKKTGIFEKIFEDYDYAGYDIEPQ